MDQLNKVPQINGWQQGYFVYTPPENQHARLVYNEIVYPQFFDEQRTFINSLSEEERHILASYTYVGDEVINSIFRRTSTPETLMALVEKFKSDSKEYNFFKVPLELIKLDNVEKVCKDYVDRFNMTFSKVPSLSISIKVYRGTKQPISELKGYTSTTYYPFDVITNDNFTSKDCCVYEYTLTPGIKALWLESISDAPNEREILLGPVKITQISEPVEKELWTIIGSKKVISKKIKKLVYEATLSNLTGGYIRTRRSKRKARKTHRR